MGKRKQSCHKREQWKNSSTSSLFLHQQQHHNHNNNNKWNPFYHHTITHHHHQPILHPLLLVPSSSSTPSHLHHFDSSPSNLIANSKVFPPDPPLFLPLSINVFRSNPNLLFGCCVISKIWFWCSMFWWNQENFVFSWFHQIDASFGIENCRLIFTGISLMTHMIYWIRFYYWSVLEATVTCLGVIPDTLPSPKNTDHTHSTTWLHCLNFNSSENFQLGVRWIT